METLREEEVLRLEEAVLRRLEEKLTGKRRWPEVKPE